MQCFGFLKVADANRISILQGGMLSRKTVQKQALIGRRFLIVIKRGICV